MLPVLFLPQAWEKPCIHAGSEKDYRRLPCGFSRALSTAKALFPQVFCGFFRFFSVFRGFLAFFAYRVGLEALPGAGKHSFARRDDA
jgi:hypothetical protein